MLSEAVEAGVGVRLAGVVSDLAGRTVQDAPHQPGREHRVRAAGGFGQVRQGGASDVEPGCWSVTIDLVSGERVGQNVAGALARAVRAFVRQLGDGFPTPRVACEPPTAWTVLEDPALLDEVLPGVERLLVEAWAGGDPQHRERVEPEPPAAEEREPDSGTRLLLRVDVATDRSAGAEWQARAVASRVARNGKITRVARANSY
ncbi:hypothetical protein [Saccharothrix syringae]|uniref:Uncharacterized protein n=1 Tax=Saccharothrix syringae TaxID=103733 RepID=A0A5Q0H308_SACSY|nr:hypothetical protein [Saccharothrix syringae]QFZ20102.1 hypothetical protein EKG83_24180 [Saccharothrix syringae]